MTRAAIRQEATLRIGLSLMPTCSLYYGHTRYATSGRRLGGNAAADVDGEAALLFTPSAINSSGADTHISLRLLSPRVAIDAPLRARHRFKSAAYDNAGHFPFLKHYIVHIRHHNAIVAPRYQRA